MRKEQLLSGKHHESIDWLGKLESICCRQSVKRSISTSLPNRTKDLQWLAIIPIYLISLSINNPSNQMNAIPFLRRQLCLLAKNQVRVIACRFLSSTASTGRNVCVRGYKVSIDLLPWVPARLVTHAPTHLDEMDISGPYRSEINTRAAEALVINKNETPQYLHQSYT